MDISGVDSIERECDEFVRSMENATLCRLPAWGKMVEKAVGHKAFCIVARDKGKVVGVLPMTHVRSRMFGNRIVSQPFSNYGGPLAVDMDVAATLCRRAVEIGSQLNCSSVEFRSLGPIGTNYRLRTDKVTMFLPLCHDPEEMWNGFDKQIRKHVRKAEKSGLTVVQGAGDLLDEFYEVWTVRMHQLGTPCYPRRLFAGIIETFPSQTKIFVLRLGRFPIGCQFAYTFNGRVECRWAATRIEYNHLCPNNLLCWFIIKHYSLEGEKLLDFGRSTIGSTQHAFKMQWGAQAVQLHYQYWTADGHDLSLATPDNPKYKRKVEMWKRLPLWMTRILGPRISRSLA